MKRITIQITEEEKERLTEIADNFGATPGQIVEAFISDLTSSARSGGSDERLRAEEWLYRQTYRW